MAVKAVLFDLGNTLWHIPERPPVDEIRQETVRRIFGLLATWGIEPVGELRFLGRDIRLAVGAADKAAFDSDQVSPDITKVVQDLVAKKGIDISPEQADELWHTWNLPGSFFGRRLFDDAIDTLDELSGRGLRFGCVTNRPYAGTTFLEEVSEHGLDGYFDVMSISCDLGYMKPHPKIYEHAVEGLGIAPSEAVMVGDSLKADVAGAQALGMVGVWNRHHEIDEENVDHVEPDFVIDELSELLDIPILQPGADAPAG
jgi:HAD superfamily hydrolase (TIGR01549 family)